MPFILRPDETNNIIMRPSQCALPAVPLPFYPRTIGHFIVKKGNEENTPENRKHFVELFWCIAGCGEVFLNGNWRKVEPGCCFYHLPDEPHRHRATGDIWECRWVCFDGDGAALFMKSYRYSREVFRAGKCPEELFIGIEKLLLVRTPFAWRKMVALIVRILSLAGGEDASEEFELAARAAALCREHYSDPEFNINALTDMLRVDRSTLIRHFRKKMYMPPSEYLFQQRIQRAFTLLRKNRIPLAEIASRSGFSDMNYLCRVIRKTTGKTPAQFRIS